MDAVLAQPEVTLEATLEQRRREVMLERIRAVARSKPEVLASVILQWIDHDLRNRQYSDLELHRTRRKILEKTEWSAHLTIGGARNR